jgi:hypothetical protein
VVLVLSSGHPNHSPQMGGAPGAKKKGIRGWNMAQEKYSLIFLNLAQF